MSNVLEIFLDPTKLSIDRDGQLKRIPNTRLPLGISWSWNWSWNWSLSKLSLPSSIFLGNVIDGRELCVRRRTRKRSIGLGVSMESRSCAWLRKAFHGSGQAQARPQRCISLTPFEGDRRSADR